MPGFADSFSPRVNFSNTRVVHAGRQSGTGIVEIDAHERLAVGFETLRADREPRIGGRVFRGVLEQVRKEPLHQHGVELQERQVGGKAHLDGPRAEHRRHARSAAPTVSSSSDHCRFSCRPPACRRAMSSSW